MEESTEGRATGTEYFYEYLLSRNYFKNIVVNGLGYGSFLRESIRRTKKQLFERAWKLKGKADSVYYGNPHHAYRLWLESLQIYISLGAGAERKNGQIEEINAFADSIIRFIQPGHIIPLKVFLTVKISLEYHINMIRGHIQKINHSIQSAYSNKVVITPYSELEQFIKDRVNSIYYE
ncbi:hypothetical protein NEAUS04_1567 [Nematocida ausubeli]|uniref:Uncharacterized protein n=1 Tax=Nematocida ausubeli (strain ATCC PRA-371 / ERTm2) TaxID=1913371 RepID=H8ZFU4_NEMA1|nr:uncharacterized protein NESG_00510 [Nematocida ausubeli]EHY64496.1 hypothetical protein NERG_02465 [Nematocida ausubeli]KAI5134121.1 hypothetical protein NEAUS06_0930 [Nematocida ausubeli]KAI5134138.1 hypothetical protein NEAUS06_0947 [Nematocida ausubeli]KAI5136643.1 hypothetical protein NEAUS07_1645 [Nematocida ausubeli]KAI5149291.1 hypothetical protein NEAUS05_1714 [Nematocida ausubeli]